MVEPEKRLTDDEIGQHIDQTLEFLMYDLPGSPLAGVIRALHKVADAFLAALREVQERRQRRCPTCRFYVFYHKQPESSNKEGVCRYPHIWLYGRNLVDFFCAYWRARDEDGQAPPENEDEWGRSYGRCPHCGTPWTMVRPGKGQPACECGEVGADASA